MFSPGVVVAPAATPAVVGVLGVARSPISAGSVLYDDSSAEEAAQPQSLFTFSHVEEDTDSSESESESEGEATPPDLVFPQPQQPPRTSLTAVANAAAKERLGDPKAVQFPLHRWKEDIGAHLYDWNEHAITQEHHMCLPNPEQVKAAKKVAMYAVYGQLAGWVSSDDDDDEGHHDADYEMNEDEKPECLPSPSLFVVSPRDYSGDC
jgi:hypothetical protein